MGVNIYTRCREKARSYAIDLHIKRESINCAKADVILLGFDPEQSKIVRQLKVQHGSTNDELMHYRLRIYQNCLSYAQALVRAVRETGIEYANTANQANADRILAYDIGHTPSSIFSPEIAQAILQIWQDSIIPKVLNLRYKFCIWDEADHFFEEILRIGSPYYMPTSSDILNIRESGVRFIETCFAFGEFRMVVVDNGRGYAVRKYMHRFEDIACVLFCSSLSDYDKILQENSRENELHASIVYFDSVAKSRWFKRTSLIVLLTGVDEFRNKLRKAPLETYFPEYTGGTNVDDALEYIRSQFTQVNSTGVPVSFLLHEAKDQTTLHRLFAIVQRTVLQNAREEFRRKPSLSAARRTWSLRRSTLPPALTQFRRPWTLGLL